MASTCVRMTERVGDNTTITDNDPSAGSPTETLLRLLLPLNDQVRSSSRHDVHEREERKRHQSEDLTKPFNR